MPRTAQKKPRKPGPPPHGPFEEKRKTLTTRITQELRERLEGAAEKTGRSLSQEIELRLEHSFALDSERYALFGGMVLYRVMALLATVINLVEEQTGKKWTKDPRTYAEVKDAIQVFFERFRPEAARGLHGVFATSIGRTAVDAVFGYIQETRTVRRGRSGPRK